MNMARENTDAAITEAQAHEHDLLAPLLQSVLYEVKEFSKKKQDEPLNKLKVRAANKILSRIKTLLANEPTVEFLELLDEDTLPTNSDAVIIMAQHVSAMQQFRSKYYRRTTMGDERWSTRDNPIRR
jgi:hypothetical protein